MFSDLIQNSEDFDLSFKVFHELMARKVTDILLVSSPYEAFIMEEEGRLAERIIYEYRGLNLSRPPMLTWMPCPTKNSILSLPCRRSMKSMPMIWEDR